MSEPSACESIPSDAGYLYISNYFSHYFLFI